MPATVEPAADAIEAAAAHLALWNARQPGPDAAARRAATAALAAIDDALLALYATRSELVTQTRRADDETAIRVDALLARHDAEEGGPE